MIPPPPLLPPPVTRRRWGSPVERERRARIRIAVYAYAYEFFDHSLVTDAEYDTLSRSINPSLETGNHALDNFFATRYSADTGLWIHEHPDLAGVHRTYMRHYVQRGSA